MAAIGAVGAAGAQAIQAQGAQQIAQKQVTQPVAQQAQKISKFQNVMKAQQTQQTQQVTQGQQVQQAKLQVAQQKVQARNRIQEAQKGSMNKLISNVVKGQNKMDQIMEAATSGKKFSPQELLAMQTGMYRYTHELEMVTKIVEKTTEGVKKTMGTQV
jgi:small-conductance mechanosensitive channel